MKLSRTGRFLRFLFVLWCILCAGPALTLTAVGVSAIVADLHQTIDTVKTLALTVGPISAAWTYGAVGLAAAFVVLGVKRED